MIKFWKNEKDENKLRMLEDLAKKIREAKKEKVALTANSETKKLIFLVEELNRKFDELKEILAPKFKSSVVEQKKEEEILSLLNRYKTLTSSQLSGLIGLSRTRCNEYLKKLERKGITESLTIGRKKVYRIKDEVLKLNRKNEIENKNFPFKTI
jgi:Fic family protein